MFGQMKMLSNILLKKIDKIEVESNKCLKVRAVTSSCSACMDVCPANSIEISQDSIEINESCIDCGLCTVVCQTNALKWNHPPLMQILDQLKRLSKSEAKVYIACAASMKGTARANVVEVPCLGMLPTEFWMSAGLHVPGLQIFHQPQSCHTCQTADGERLFLEQKNEAENIINHTFPICDSIKIVKDDRVDHQRRKLLTSLFEEVKETNTITVKEVLEVDKTLSPFEKFNRYHKQQYEMEELVETAEEMKNNVIDRLMDGNVIHTDKRALLLKTFEKEPELKEKVTFSIPEIKESCTRCGACAFLCPTDAIIMDDNSLVLSPNKCISCGLCEEICYEKHIGLKPTKATILNENFMYLLR